MAENTKKTYVIDASYVLNFLMPDEQSVISDAIFEQYKNRHIDLISVSLLPFEVYNSLNAAIIRKRLKNEEAIKLLKFFDKLKIQYTEINFPKAFKTCIKYNLSYYDASYLYLSKHLHYPLLSLDKHLLKYN